MMAMRVPGMVVKILRSQQVLISVAAAAMIGVVAFAVAKTQPSTGDSGSAVEFEDVRRETMEYIEYNRTIVLTVAQERVKEEALSSLPAPCCNDRSAHTCCCTCNSARAWWGLAKHLIADEGYNAEQVRTKVSEWFDFINPGGFSGDSCYTGGCGRSFAENGCGGMSSSRVVF